MSAKDSFEVQFFGPRIQAGQSQGGRPNYRRECCCCRESVSDQQERRRNHLKSAKPGSVCATNFQLKKKLTFQRFVFATQTADTYGKLYPDQPVPLPGDDVIGSVAVVDPSPGPLSGDGGGGSSGGGSGWAAADSRGTAVGHTPAATLPDPRSPPSQAAPHPSPTDPGSAFAHGGDGGASGRSGMRAGNFLWPPRADEILRFQRQFVRAHLACGHSINSMLHPEKVAMVKLLRPGMEVHIPSRDQAM
jgi:hypothetical protein